MQKRGAPIRSSQNSLLESRKVASRDEDGIKVHYFVDKARIDLKSKVFYLPHADHTLDKYNKQYINRDPNNKNLVNCCDKLKSILLGKPQVELTKLPTLIKLHFPKQPR
ncbi:hypothetical protein RND71_024190 [Anisodus tanguticus]|uniref:DM2 domain-containing protein n=1 Tax=Anisodus tanguticus TaxID=243964 RepID=A0AAE1RQ66_9SOLA|nr:hypothetical protein RND71_024190 [Anisodus tanguticus]